MLIVGGVLAALPLLGLPLFYESFLYLVFHWIVLATSWNILSGYSGYFSFGHGAFFGAGMYTTATLASRFDVPFLWTLPAAALVATVLGARARRRRLPRARGPRRALRARHAGGHVRRRDDRPQHADRRRARRLSRAPSRCRRSGRRRRRPSTCWDLRRRSGRWRSPTRSIARSSALGLFAIHDDEDVAEVLGVPTYRYKLLAFAVSSGLAGIAGGLHAMFVSYVTAGDTFTITVPLTVVLMSVLGGTRHWAGPAVGAAIITALLYAFTAGRSRDRRQGGLRRRADRGHPVHAAGRARQPRRAASAPDRCRDDSAGERRPAGPRKDRLAAAAARRIGSWWRAGSARHSAACSALDGVDIDVREGEILGLVGPNGSGKSTFINLVSGHYRADGGELAFRGADIARLPAHRIARAGHRAHLPDSAPLRPPDRHRQCRGAGDVRGGAARSRRRAARRHALARFHGTRGQGAVAAGGSQSAPAQVPRARARAGLAAAAPAAGRSAVGADAHRDRRRDPADPQDPRRRRDDRVRRARDARRARADGPRRGARLRPGDRRGLAPRT